MSRVACWFDVRERRGSSDGTKLQFAVGAVTVVAIGDVDFGDAVVAVTVVAVAVGCGCSNGGCSRRR